MLIDELDLLHSCDVVRKRPASVLRLVPRKKLLAVIISALVAQDMIAALFTYIVKRRARIRTAPDGYPSAEPGACQFRVGLVVHCRIGMATI
jgi:hypothetical protein